MSQKAAAKVVPFPRRPWEGDPRVTLREASLLELFWRVGRKTQRIWARQAWAAGELGVSAKTVSRCIRSLEEKGWFSVENHGRRGLRILLHREPLAEDLRWVRPAAVRQSPQLELFAAPEGRPLDHFISVSHGDPGEGELGADPPGPPGLVENPPGAGEIRGQNVRDCGGNEDKNGKLWITCGPKTQAGQGKSGDVRERTLVKNLTGKPRIMICGERDHRRRGPPVENLPARAANEAGRQLLRKAKRQNRRAGK